MIESRVLQIKKKVLQERLYALEKEYTALNQQLNHEGNAATLEKLKRQILEKEKEMQEVEDELNSLIKPESTLDSLLQILQAYQNSDIIAIKRAYQVCCPQGFLQQSDTVEDILATLQDLPSNHQKFTPLDFFVAQRRGETYQARPEEIELVNAALYLRRPLLVTGKPGTGKTSLAYAVAYELNLGEVLHWSITTRTTLKDGLDRYDAIGRLQDAKGASEDNLKEIGNYIDLGPLGTYQWRSMGKARDNDNQKR
ncbi:hypothetical protein NUACC26_037100 [Scytonema sp. NUACC26]